MRSPSATMLQKARTVLGAVQGGSAALPHLYESIKPIERVPAPDGNAPLAYCLLGAPGVGKGTYSTKLSKWLGVPHVSTGELVRAEIKRKTDFGRQMCDIVSKGGLLPDDMIMEVVVNRMAEGVKAGELGFLLDGFPRTRAQALALMDLADVQLALNLTLRESVLVDKCLGRRICSKCGKNFNIADISLPAANGQPEIIMPPLNPPAACVKHMETRSDDTIQVIRERLRVYNEEAGPVERVFEDHGLLLNFEITGGIPETLPKLREVVQPFLYHLEEKRAA
eukprot:jgi/Botrbrau1/6748/Bobra.0324s0033.1